MGRGSRVVWSRACFSMRDSTGAGAARRPRHPGHVQSVTFEWSATLDVATPEVAGAASPSAFVTVLTACADAVRASTSGPTARVDVSRDGMARLKASRAQAAPANAVSAKNLDFDMCGSWSVGADSRWQNVGELKSGPAEDSVRSIGREERTAQSRTGWRLVARGWGLGASSPTALSYPDGACPFLARSPPASR